MSLQIQPSFLLLSLILPALPTFTSGVHAGEPATQSPVDKISLDPMHFGDLARVLGVTTTKGEFQLKAKVTHIAIRLDFYKSGTRLDRHSQAPGYYQTVDDQAFASGKYAVHTVDLDYLPLGDRKPQHARFHIELGTGDGAICGGFVDVPKNVFDPGRGMIILPFGPVAARSGEAPLGGEAPLFYLLSHTESPHGGGKTIEEVVKMNPKADIVIAILVFK